MGQQELGAVGPATPACLRTLHRGVWKKHQVFLGYSRCNLQDITPTLGSGSLV